MSKFKPRPKLCTLAILSKPTNKAKIAKEHSCQPKEKTNEIE